MYFVVLHAEFQTLESAFGHKTGVEHIQKNKRRKDSEWNDICYNVVTMCSSSLTAVFRKRSETNTTHQWLTWLEGILSFIVFITQTPQFDVLGKAVTKITKTL